MTSDPRPIENRLAEHGILSSPGPGEARYLYTLSSECIGTADAKQVVALLTYLDKHRSDLPGFQRRTQAWNA